MPVDYRETLVDSSQLPETSDEFDPDTFEFLYAGHMKARERAFDTIFGVTEPPNTILTPDDPVLMINWPGGGVFTFPPNDQRTGWHYVTHGLAQPMQDDLPSATVPDDNEPISGLGVELVISTPQKCAWAPDVLFKLAKYVLFEPDGRVILPGHRIPCNGPLVLGTNTPLRHLLAMRSPEYPSNLHLPAGYCWLVHLVGASDDEIAYAKGWGSGEGGSRILEAVFAQMGVGCLSDPERPSLTENPDFPKIWPTEDRLEAEWRAEGWNGEDKNQSPSSTA